MINPFVIHKAVNVDLSSTDWTLAGEGESKLTKAPDALYVGTAAGGNVVAQLAGETAAKTYTGLAGGAWYPMSVVAITKTGTTADLQVDGILKVGWVRP